jgi:hypothetical protein
MLRVAFKSVELSVIMLNVVTQSVAKRHLNNKHFLHLRHPSPGKGSYGDCKKVKRIPWHWFVSLHRIRQVFLLYLLYLASAE